MFLVITKPLLAKSITGCKMVLTSSFPKRFCASKIPAMVPGTPTAEAPNVLILGITSPLSSKYMSLCAAFGAFSR